MRAFENRADEGYRAAMDTFPRESDTVAPAGGAESLRVLAVDDDPALRKLVRMGLGDLGYEVDLADSVAQAMTCLRTRPYSVVLSDYDMPGGSGLDLLTYVTRVYPDLPFIMLTGHDETPLARSAISSGALDFLAKPFGVQQLARTIEQNLARFERNRAVAAELTSEVLTGTICALVAAVDAKDPHTAHHSGRVTQLALRLGESLGLPPDRLRVLEFAALLHDVGKIGVPEAILLKPGPLDVGERAVMQEHPVRSAQIVSQVGRLAEVAGIVRHHHERMDGTGYPDGLAGDAIHPLSRLIAVADVYEALTAHRAYRPAFTHAKAREILRDSLGTHLDPQMGEAFLRLTDLP